MRTAALEPASSEGAAEERVRLAEVELACAKRRLKILAARVAEAEREVEAARLWKAEEGERTWFELAQTCTTDAEEHFLASVSWEASGLGPKDGRLHFSACSAAGEVVARWMVNSSALWMEVHCLAADAFQDEGLVSLQSFDGTQLPTYEAVVGQLPLQADEKHLIVSFRRYAMPLRREVEKAEMAELRPRETARRLAKVAADAAEASRRTREKAERARDHSNAAKYSKALTRDIEAQAYSTQMEENSRVAQEHLSSLVAETQRLTEQAVAGASREMEAARDFLQRRVEHERAAAGKVVKAVEMAEVAVREAKTMLHASL